MGNQVHIQTQLSDIRGGDTVLVKGVLTTVGNKDIKRCSFMGTSIFGSSYPRTITKVLFKVPTNKGIIYR